MAIFNGNLTQNKIFDSLYNMIISQSVEANNITPAGNNIVDLVRKDSGLYGDRVLKIQTDALASVPFVEDSEEALNLLAIKRPPKPVQETVVIDTARMIEVTTGSFLEKQAFMNAGIFEAFNSVVIGWVNDTKALYSNLLIKTYVGTTAGKEVSVPVSDYADVEDIEAKNRLEAQEIARSIADLLDDMEEASRKYNALGLLRTYKKDDLAVIWNKKFINKITKLDLPTIYNNAGLADFGKYKMAPEFFGEINAQGGTTASTNTTVRSLVEKDYGAVHVFPGDLLPNATAYLANETYTVDDDVICKIIHKDSVQYLDAVSVASEFVNVKNKTTNHYMHFAYGLGKFDAYPFITVHAD